MDTTEADADATGATRPARRAHGFVRGRVQGVWFRGSMEAEARRLRLHGWVRNRRDGRVEFVAQGPAADIDALLQWARRGPENARVDALSVDDEPPAGDVPPFEVRPTA